MQMTFEKVEYIIQKETRNRKMHTKKGGRMYLSSGSYSSYLRPSQGSNEGRPRKRDWI